MTQNCPHKETKLKFTNAIGFMVCTECDQHMSPTEYRLEQVVSQLLTEIEDVRFVAKTSMGVLESRFDAIVRDRQRLREAAQEAVDEYYNTPSEPDYYLASMQKLEAALKQEGG
jgi:hypothetical protein